MTVLRHVVESITPASSAHADAARRCVAAAGAPVLERLAARLGGAQHTPRPHARHRTIVVVAGDHGVGDPGIALGDAHPTAVAARAIAGGTAALAHVARASTAPILLVDAGTAAPMPESAVQLGRGPTRNLLAEPAMTVVDAALALEAGIALAVSLVDQGLDVLAVGALGVGAEVAAAALLGAALGAAGSVTPVSVDARGGGGPGAEATALLGAARGATGSAVGSSGDATPGRGAPGAATRVSVDARGGAPGAAPVSVDARGGGVPGAGAEATALLDGARGAAAAATPVSVDARGGAEATAVLGATGSGPRAPASVAELAGDAEAIAAFARGAAFAQAGALDRLAAFGGGETAVLAGLLLGCASMNVPVILDGHATGAAALVADAFAPAVRGYLIAAHAGTFVHRRILDHLGLSPVFEVGLGHGEGTGAAMVIPLVDQVAAVARGG